MDTRYRWQAYFPIIAIFLSACAPNPTTPAVLPTRPPPSASLTEEIQSPNSTDDALPPKLFIVADPSMHRQIQQHLLVALQDLTADQGWALEQRASYPAEDVDSQLRVVVALPPAPDIEQWADLSPQVQFVAVGISGLGTKHNLSLLGANGFREDQLSFLAGYLAAVITPDWRVATLIDEGAGIRAAGFRNGMIYFCGLCRLTYPPYYDYPLSFALKANRTDEDWRQAADFFAANAVDTLFINMQLGDTEMLQILMNSELNFIGVSMPADAERWIATLRFAPEISIREKWNDILEEKGGWRAEIPLLVEDVNQELLSIGRLQWIEKMIDELQTGFIDPSVTPISPD
ncbi:MAG: hypothetical protein IIC78_04540 [Chloroflexi bacterium]|nr:hypothetical protein [Chloroflexota bacterium]